MKSLDESHPGSGPFFPVRVARYLLPLVLLGLAVHFILPQLATLNHSLRIIRGMVLWVVGLAVAAQILSYLGSGYLIKKVVAVAGQRLTIARATLILRPPPALDWSPAERWPAVPLPIAGCIDAA